MNTTPGKTIGSRHFHRPATCFRDGKRKIDFVLALEISKDNPNKDTDQMKQNRNEFVKRLEAIGIQMEEERTEGTKVSTIFVKVHIPWAVMCANAEYLHFRVPLKVQNEDGTRTNFSESLLSFFRIRNLLMQTVPNTPHYYYTCRFKAADIHRINKLVASIFLSGLGCQNIRCGAKPAGQNKMVYASLALHCGTRERQQVAYSILSRTRYGEWKHGEVGIDALVNIGAYSAAYPLHDGDFRANNDTDIPPEQWNQRRVLHHYWARWSRWFKYQPIGHVREYFGEKIAFYFAFLGFYSTWLVPAAFFGLVQVIVGCALLSSDKTVAETCSATSITMCPLCDGCAVWPLSARCWYAREAAILDHPGTVFFSVFMSFWAVAFVDNWKRKTAELAYKWDTLEMADEEEPQRPTYVENCTESRVNPVTDMIEPTFSPRRQTVRIILGLGVTLVMICVVLGFIFVDIIYRAALSMTIGNDVNETIPIHYGWLVSALTSGGIYIVVIQIFGKVYIIIATKLTEWEMHRTDSEFEDQLIIKVVVFQFINYYSSIFYLAFLKGRFVGYPGNYNRIFGLRLEECQGDGCFTDVTTSIVIFMLATQAFGNLESFVVHKLYSWWHKRHFSSTHTSRSRWEVDYQLANCQALMPEYLLMVIQYGFTTIFGAAFPLAPLFALVNNLIEIRIDANKFIRATRRPIAERCRGIGVWLKILKAMAYISVIGNAFQIALTSTFLPKQLYRYMYDSTLTGYVNFTLAWAPVGSVPQGPCRYRDFRDERGEFTPFYWKLQCLRLLFIVAFEHLVFAICKIVDSFVPNIPKNIDLHIKRKRYLTNTHKQQLLTVD